MNKVAQLRGRVAENVGMQWVMTAIRLWLFAVAAADGPHFNSPIDAWEQAVDGSEYESSLQ